MPRTKLNIKKPILKKNYEPHHLYQASHFQTNKKMLIETNTFIIYIKKTVN